MTSKNIMIVGVGGQGTLLTSRILGKLAIGAGFDVKLSEVHGMAQRGDSVVTFVRYGEKVAEPIVEEGQADVLIAFERLEALRYLHFLKKDGVVIVNDWRIDPITVVTGVAQYPDNILQFFFRQIISTQLRAHILNRFPQFPGQIRQGHIAFQQQGLDYFRHSHTRPHPLRAKIVYQIIDNCKNKSNMLTQHLKTILTISIF